MHKIVFCDVDGTLLNSSYHVTAMTQQAIKTLENKKIPFVLVSARSPAGIYPILETYNFKTPVIACGGAIILDRDRNLLYEKGMKKSTVCAILSYIEMQTLDLSWCIYTPDQWIVQDTRDTRILREEYIVKAKAQQGNVDSIKAKEISKILCICKPSDILKIEEKLKYAFPDVNVCRSSDILIEIMAKEVSKSEAVRWLCNLWNISLEEAVAFGDHYNDEEMLNTVGVGILMGNAPQELKAKIRNHTKDCDHDGIYEALLKLELL